VLPARVEVCALSALCVEVCALSALCAIRVGWLASLAFSLRVLGGLSTGTSRFVVPHILRKTSEMWGTRDCGWRKKVLAKWAGGREKRGHIRFSENDRRAAPAFFGPSTPRGKPGQVGRTWGTRPISCGSSIPFRGF
jgi:hypothetical protein